MGTWHSVPMRGPKPTCGKSFLVQGVCYGIGRGHSIHPTLGALPTTQTQKGQGEKHSLSLCPLPRGTETPIITPTGPGVM